MSKEKYVTIKMNTYTAAAVRQVLFDSQKQYTYDEVSVPPRITSIRSVILDLDQKIEENVTE